MTAPLEGLLVDKAKYSENVGHHLVHITGKGVQIRIHRWQRRGEKNRMGLDASSTSADQPWLGEHERNNRLAFGNFQSLT